MTRNNQMCIYIYVYYFFKDLISFSPVIIRSLTVVKVSKRFTNFRYRFICYVYVYVQDLVVVWFLFDFRRENVLFFLLQEIY